MNLNDLVVPNPMSPVKVGGLILGMVVFAIIQLSPTPEGLSAQGWDVISVAALMAIWWISEAVPISATALIPLVLFPVLDVGSIREAAKGYSGPAIFLTLGGFMIGVALERWNLHTRIAMHTVKLVGTKPRRVVAGFMLATALLSMWITNTATTVMMLPIAYSVATLLMKEGVGSDSAKRNFGIALMLGLAYAASIGGMMTLVGTSTNVFFKGYFEQTFGIEITFMQWMMIGVPVGIVMLGACWSLLTFLVYPCALESGHGVGKIIQDKLKELGKMTTAEKRVAIIFAITAFLWMFKKPLREISPLFDVHDASIAMFGALLLFMTPSGNEKGRYLMEWQNTQKVPWGILLLLGGGLTMASAMNDTGVATWMGDYISSFSTLTLLWLVIIVTVMIIFLSEAMSNVATLSAFLPVVVAISLGFDENPLILAVPAALVASCAFMLPIATPPNAIVFGSGLIQIPDMARAGFMLNIIGLVVINIICYLLLPVVFGVEAGVLPDWAQGVELGGGEEIAH